MIGRLKCFIFGHAPLEQVLLPPTTLRSGQEFTATFLRCPRCGKEGL